MQALAERAERVVFEASDECVLARRGKRIDNGEAEEEGGVERRPGENERGGDAAAEDEAAGEGDELETKRERLVRRKHEWVNGREDDCHRREEGDVKKKHAKTTTRAFFSLGQLSSHY